MMASEHRDMDPVQLAEMLGESIQRIDRLFAFKRRINHVLIGLAVTICLDIAITITLVLFFNTLHNAQLSACHTANSTRRDQIVIWEGIVNKFGAKRPTPAQAKKNKEFLAFVGQTFKPINCSNLYGR